MTESGVVRRRLYMLARNVKGSSPAARGTFRCCANCPELLRLHSRKDGWKEVTAPRQQSTPIHIRQHVLSVRHEGLGTSGMRWFSERCIANARTQRQSLARVARQQNTTTLRRTFAVSAVVKGNQSHPARRNPSITALTHPQPTWSRTCTSRS